MSYSKRPAVSSYTKLPRRPLYPGSIHKYGEDQDMPRQMSEGILRNTPQSASPRPQPRQNQDLTLGHITQSMEVNLKNQTVDPAATLALRDPRLRAQYLCSLAQKAKIPLELEIKESTLQDQAPRRFQLIRMDVEKNLFQADNQPLVTARLPTHKEILERAQQQWKNQHQDDEAPQEAELIGKGYVAKAQAELIALENARARQAEGYMAALRNELHPFGYTLLATA